MRVKCPLGVGGHIVGDTYYVLKQQNHFMRIFQGFGISESVLDYLKSSEIIKFVNIKWFGVKSTIVYKVRIDKFYNSNKIFEYNNPDRTKEVDKQKFVSVADMEILQTLPPQGDFK